jgi:hypothetical protein
MSYEAITGTDSLPGTLPQGNQTKEWHGQLLQYTAYVKAFGPTLHTEAFGTGRCHTADCLNHSQEQNTSSLQTMETTWPGRHSCWLPAPPANAPGLWDAVSRACMHPTSVLHPALNHLAPSPTHHLLSSTKWG